MQGQITKFRDDLGVGVIMTDDGRRFRFARDEVMSSTSNLIGEEVDFVLSASRPSEIVVLSCSPWAAFGTIGERG